MSVTRFDPAGPLRGTARVPGDKSISHRAALLGAMGEGTTRIAGYLDSADTHSTLDAVRALGAGVSRSGDSIQIRGVGLRGARPAEIDVGNAGTLLRVLPGWLAGQPAGTWTLDGDESIRRRPVDRIAEPLLQMGAVVETRDGTPPLQVAAAPLRGITYELPVASAQVKSCLLLAGLLAAGRTELLEPVPTRDHTERMLAAAGAELSIREDGAMRRISVGEAERIEASDLQVPGDFSSAAFLLCAAVLVPASRVQLPAVGVNPTRTGLLEVLRRMGAEVALEERSDEGGEPLATLVAGHSDLKGASVGAAEVPLMIDELPLVALLGCFAEGETEISGAEELRHKESDRIATVAAAIRGVGGRIEPTGDGWRIEGAGGLAGGSVDAAGDHRIAMLGAVAGLASKSGVEVAGIEAARVSYPGLAADLAGLVGPG